MNKILNKNALVAFVCAGDPTIETSKEIILQTIKAGADMVQIGIPFSDPVAEDPIIQQATVRALKNGANLKNIFQMVEQLREQTQVPFLFSVYLNTVFKCGYDNFFKKCEELKISGVIIPDLPLEEKAEVEQFAKNHKIALVPIITSASDDRIETILKNSDELLYLCPSCAWINQEDMENDLKNLALEIKKTSNLPCIISCEIETCAQAQKMSKLANGIIVGNEIVRLVGKLGTNATGQVFEYIKSIKEVIKY